MLQVQKHLNKKTQVTKYHYSLKKNCFIFLLN